MQTHSNHKRILITVLLAFFSFIQGAKAYDEFGETYDGRGLQESEAVKLLEYRDRDQTFNNLTEDERIEMQQLQKVQDDANADRAREWQQVRDREAEEDARYNSKYQKRQKQIRSRTHHHGRVLHGTSSKRVVPSKKHQKTK